MKAVLMSIQPKWCDLIADGKKTVEVRKTKPKIAPPFKVYIYCTKGDALAYPCLNNPKFTIHRTNNGTLKGRQMTAKEREKSDHLYANGKVIGEFVCKGIEEVYQCNSGWVEAYACIPRDEFFDYLGIPRRTHLGYDKNAYGWLISDLVIYEKPMELSEFKRVCDGNCQECKYAIWQTRHPYDDPIIVDCKPISVPQSWCYVWEEGT